MRFPLGPHTRWRSGLSWILTLAHASLLEPSKSNHHFLYVIFWSTVKVYRHPKRTTPFFKWWRAGFHGEIKEFQFKMLRTTIVPQIHLYSVFCCSCCLCLGFGGFQTAGIPKTPPVTPTTQTTNRSLNIFSKWVTKKTLLLSIESWLFNRDPLVVNERIPI